MTLPKFAYANATTIEETVLALSETCRPLAGGTDLVTRMKDDIVEPECLVNIKTLKDLSGIENNAGAWTIGALTTLQAIANDAALNEVPALACLVEAAAGAASPQIRHAATIGGNLVQQPRCWYYRNSDIPCWRKDGERCYAVQGENQYHVILNRRSPCNAVHPSDPAVALLALDASVTVVDPEKTQKLALADFYCQPTNDWRHDTIVQPNMLVTQVTIPAPAPNSRSVYLKVAERSSWDFAIASAAFVLTFDGGLVTQARIALGGVAVNPLRREAAEQSLIGKPLTDETIAAAAELAVDGARPMSQNAYKVDLVKGVVTQALQSFR